MTSASTSDLYLNFSKNQEREADYFAIETLKKLELYSDSIIELLKSIEKNGLEKGITKEKLRTSTHPNFDERINLIEYVNGNKIINFDENLNKDFKFIQAKFLAYNSNNEIINKLDNPYKKYANSILKSKNEDLKSS